ncbi:MAG: PEP-CTERM sorting domain-containing protein [Colwellia sp.]|nr:PEP-CTERM sorting domain-containing protein [Colwellia sp.]
MQDTDQKWGSTQEVPEPSTLAIFALGMIGLASRRYNKKS